MQFLDSAELIKQQRNIQTPFQLRLGSSEPFCSQSVEGEKTIIIKTILRIVPGNRVVGLSNWGGSDVVVKLFYKRGRWKRHLDRELKGDLALVEAGIATPALIAQAIVVDKEAGLLVFDFLSEAISLTRWVNANKDSAQAKTKISQTVNLIAQCHSKAIWQQDIHPDNFLVLADSVYMIDGADVRQEKSYEAIGSQTRLANLSLFLAQFEVHEDQFTEDYFIAYCNADPGICSNDLNKDISNGDPGFTAEGLKRAVVRARKSRLNLYRKRHFRSTSDQIHRRQHNRFMVFKRNLQTADLSGFIADPDKVINAGEVLKAGDTTTVVRINLDGKSYILKRYNIKKFWHGIKLLFKSSRAQSSWRNALLLEMLGIATSHPFMMMEERILWVFTRRAYFISAVVDGELVSDYVEKNQSHLEKLEPLFSEYRNLLATMETYQISHGDMKATNFIYSDDRLHVLDLDAMRQHGSKIRFINRFRKDLNRLRKNWIENRTLDARVMKLISEFKKLSG